MNLEYAEYIIKNHPYLFDAIEISGVEDLGNGIVEVSDKPDFWSVYLHMKEGGVQCVGDFTRLENAKDYAESLSKKYGWEITYQPPTEENR